MTEYEELIEKVARVLLEEFGKGLPVIQTRQFWYDKAHQILQTSTDTLRFAVVKIQGELPKCPYCKGWWDESQQVMLEKGYVQEVKPEEEENQ